MNEFFLEDLVNNFYAATKYLQYAKTTLNHVFFAFEKTRIIMSNPEDWNKVKYFLTVAESYFVAFKADVFDKENTEIKVNHFYYHYNRLMGTNTFIGIVEEVLSLTDIILPEKYHFYLYRLEDTLTETIDFCNDVIEDHYDLFSEWVIEDYDSMD